MKATKGKNKGRKKAQGKVKERKTENGDIKGIIYIFIGILLGISIYTNLTGELTGWIKGMIYNLLGIGGIILPIYLVYFGVDTIKSKGTINYSRRLFGTLLGSIAVVLIFATISLQFQDRGGFAETFEKIKDGNIVHGGFLGYIFAYPITIMIGEVCAYILYFTFLFIGGLLTFDITINDIYLFVKPTLENVISKFKRDNSKKNKISKSPKGKDAEKTTINNIVKDDEEEFIKGINNKIQILDFMKNSIIEDEERVEPQIPKVERNTRSISPTIDYIEDIEEDDFKEAITGLGKSNLDNSAKDSVNNKNIEDMIIDSTLEEKKVYRFPSVELLNNNSKAKMKNGDKKDLIENAAKLEETLGSFGVEAKVLQVTKGPSVTRFELQPSPGVKVSKIVNLQDDIALGLAASGVRMEAPIPGKSAIGIEVPNLKQTPVFLREVLDSKEFLNSDKKIAFSLGKDIAGKCVVGDLSKMPHMLIAGATGSGKSVCINTLIISILYKYSPEEVKLLMVDPKVVELSVYNGIPHLLIPVVTDPKKAAGALNWAVNEMNRRYNAFSQMKVKNIESYNNLLAKGLITEKMPYIVMIVDELADLMMACPSDVEDYICRLAQMARAAGMHLIIATQRPSVDVITGVIKANIPSRISFAVSSGTDSRTILDSVGAEKLLGRGDMLYYPIGESKPLRVQGAFISEEEVESVVEYIKETEDEVDYKNEIMEHINGEVSNGTSIKDEDSDELIDDAIAVVVEYQQASISFIQRKLKIGFNRASRIMDELEEKGIISKKDGTKPRQVLLETIDEEGI